MVSGLFSAREAPDHSHDRDQQEHEVQAIYYWKEGKPENTL